MATGPDHDGTGRGVTLEEVARAAGVSRATVSRVVNGNLRVSQDVRRVVEKAVERLGYVPNPAARMLVTRRSDSIGLIIPEPTGRLFNDPYFPRLLRGVTGELSAREMQLVLLMPQTSGESSRVERYVAAGHVDGVLLVSLHGDDPLPAHLAARSMPVVVGGRPPGAAVVSYVDVDNRHGAQAAVEHLIATGRRVIATIAGPSDMVAGVDRLAGYRAGLQAAGLTIDPGLIEVSDFSHEGGVDAMRRLVAARPEIDGLFAASDLMAAGALQVLRAAGRRVPEDVAVVGYDDSPIAATTDPPLTSVRQPVEEMGREMVRLLIEQATRPGSVPRQVILATELIRRRSSKGVRRG
jgi:DNA-binding LacI/PurR family transcriptional regulator